MNALRVEIESVQQVLFGVAGVLIVLIFRDSNEYSCPCEGTHNRVVSRVPLEGQIPTRSTAQDDTNNDRDRLEEHFFHLDPPLDLGLEMGFLWRTFRMRASEESF